jgi:hypothetical protein
VSLGGISGPQSHQGVGRVHLGGEVVIVDGEAIECTLDGPPVAMADDDILPFTIVCRFPDVPRVGLGEQDFAGFAASVEGALTSGTCSTPCASTACCRRSACGSRLVSIIRSRGSPR